MPDSSPGTDVPEPSVDLEAEVSPAGAGAREVISELGDRARAVVEELARSARARAAAPPVEAAHEVRPSAHSAHSGRAEGAAAAAFAQQDWSRLCGRVDELRACVGEVTDVLEATVERLETIELQLGDPDEAALGRVTEGVVRCERVLAGIEHRVELETQRRRSAEQKTAAAVKPSLGGTASVLVVARSSSRRAQICVALEHHGLYVLAAVDLGLALRLAARRQVSAALLVADGPSEGLATLLEEWKRYEEQGTLPPALVLETADGRDAGQFGFAVVRDTDGDAALAASLARLAASRAPEAPPIN